MQKSVKELVRARRSVRTFDGRPLSEGDLADLTAFVEGTTNPFGVPVEFRVLDAKAHGLSSAAVVGETTYLAAKVGRVEHGEIAFGYSFENACLHALFLGVGTVMLAASLSREAFEKAMDVQPGEVLPAASPIGYPASKMSVRESLMRKGLGADKRLSFEELFFEGDFAHGRVRDGADPVDEALEMARWAPSAGNKQPWRAVVCGDAVHFYEKRSMKANALGDIQKVDVGIALCHFDLAMSEGGHTGGFSFADPGIACPEDVDYIVSYGVAR